MPATPPATITWWKIKNKWDVYKYPIWYQLSTIKQYWVVHIAPYLAEREDFVIVHKYQIISRPLYHFKAGMGLACLILKPCSQKLTSRVMVLTVYLPNLVTSKTWTTYKIPLAILCLIAFIFQINWMLQDILNIRVTLDKPGFISIRLSCLIPLSHLLCLIA